ncbi:zinc finger protein 69 homolog isoform X1 [Amphibalanus amphitrite]|uniref:zinc finger protein 69 homolog isoform X1 n=2 Tax=Amphibalanus amphitrite TaxID=1232801 RepID=UPI001C909F88|nr:zinc finger protein 69 homolog isoform X1 [Amphibalanus amphitrite]XP_043220697.1 zinc finger protein 69 homolog isoform X1 [Amphibalanus amphitrite]XP_043220698.1 zinc finger protein 69 homolog isoform X1 [Amphibalanus amphitrite]XP_043220699.1 zinc finger protein 69 homolog isoform X1 [Amphibalanus amphitrite]XP_043220700.1 zinc finger protein 69 homolog isoform X1 [Amphibalanus amphitrite]
MMATNEDACSDDLNFVPAGESGAISGTESASKNSSCVLCGTNIPVSDQAGCEPGRVDIFGRLSPAYDIIVINKMAAVTGCSAADLHSRGNHICTSCHDRLLKLHSMEMTVDRERALLSEQYRRRCAPAADRPAPQSGASLLLVDDMEVRLQDDQVTAVPLTTTRRRQLLRQARSSERRFECKVCGKRFRAFSHRVEHMLIHVNETPWACELCPKTFRTKSARTAHQRVHAPAATRFSCSVCDRQLSDAASLRAHARTHEHDKPYTCDTCQHKFARRKDYAVHVRQHTGERPHACPDCPQTFVARSRLNRHLLLHREKQFACACGRAFRRRYELQKHAQSCGQPGTGGEAAPADPASVTQPDGQPAALTYLPVVLREPPAVYYQVVTPVAVEGADGAGQTPAHQAVPQGQEQALQLSVVTY